jgi:ATP-dependent helicase YprA (DUF1998 family)
VRPRRKLYDDNGDGLPLHLLAGRCIEVWAPETTDWKEAWRRFGRARRDWNAEHPGGPLLPLDQDHAPWSYEYIRETRGEEELAARLARQGLP